MNELSIEKFVLYASEDLKRQGIYYTMQTCYGFKVYSVEGLKKTHEFYPFIELHIVRNHVEKSILEYQNDTNHTSQLMKISTEDFLNA